jgi:hypothetical protein
MIDAAGSILPGVIKALNKDGTVHVVFDDGRTKNEITAT